MVSSAAPDNARWPRWMRCQSVMHPSSAEYWHIGAMTMRLARLSLPTRNGEKSLAVLMSVSAASCSLTRIGRDNPVYRLPGPKPLRQTLFLITGFAESAGEPRDGPRGAGDSLADRPLWRR